MFYQDVYEIDPNADIADQVDFFMSGVKKAYHRVGSTYLELALPKDFDGTLTRDTMLPVLQFANADAVQPFCVDRRIGYREYETVHNVTSAADLARMVDIGTHRPEFVTRVAMQSQGLSRLELTHHNRHFDLICRNLEKSEGSRFKALYAKQLEWISAGGHADADDGGEV